MNEKILIEKKLLNSLIKSFETHLSILKEGEIYIKHDNYNDKLLKSIKYINDNIDMIKNYSRDIAALKRNAYFRYSKLKKELIKMQTNNVSKDLIESKQIEVNKALELYVALKETYNSQMCNS